MDNTIGCEREKMPVNKISKLKSVCADLNPGETLITWTILNGFPDFKNQQMHDTPDVLLALFSEEVDHP